jgi:hypothetical protein
MFPRLTTSSAVQLDARFVARKLLRNPGYSRWVLRWHLGKDSSASVTCTMHPGPAIALDFSIEGRIHHRFAEMHTTTTPAVHGHHRHHWWFECPRCRRRCRILYLLHASPDFACRICLGLRYPSEVYRFGGELGAFAKLLYAADKVRLHPSVEPAPSIFDLDESFPLSTSSSEFTTTPAQSE